MREEQWAVQYLRRWRHERAPALAAALSAAPGGEAPQQAWLDLAAVKQQMPISPVLEENRALLGLLLGHGPDVTFRSLALGADRRPALLLFLDNLAKRDHIVRILDALVELRNEPLPLREQDLYDDLVQRSLPAAEATQVDCLGEAVGRVLNGESLLLVEGMTRGIGLATAGPEHRSPEEPQAEPVVRGPKDGFTETLGVNLALIRRRLQDERLRVEAMSIGSRTATRVALVHMAELAPPDLVDEVRKRLQRIEMDGILESGYIEEMIEDNPYSVFPQVRQTERPDVACSSLLQGKVTILTDGTPHVLIVPATFVGEMQAAEDYYHRWPMASFLRLLRYLFLYIALLGPASYIAVTSYHHEMIPTNLLLTLISTREGVPFPAILEAMLMEVTLEGLREAGVRLPKPLGQSLSIVGALVIGDAAVRAGLVSPAMVIVVSITAIASFILPSFSTALTVRLLRFGMMVLAGFFGFFGIAIGVMFLSLHLAGLRSFGVPYLSPVLPPTAGDAKDLAIRAPWWVMRRRPQFMPTRDDQRGSRRNRPQPPSTRGRR